MLAWAPRLVTACRISASAAHKSSVFRSGPSRLRLRPSFKTIRCLGFAHVESRARAAPFGGRRPEGPLYFELGLKMTMNRNGLISRKYAAALAVVIAPFVAIGQAEAACNPPGPVNGTVINCSGAISNPAPNTDGYGTVFDTGNIINVQSGATVTATRDGLLFNDGTVNNLGTITGARNGIGAVTVADVHNFSGINTNTGAGAAINSAGAVNLVNEAGALVHGAGLAINAAGTATIHNSGALTSTTIGVISAGTVDLVNTSTGFISATSGVGQPDP